MSFLGKVFGYLKGANVEEKDNYGNTPLIKGIFIQLFNYFK
jgi:hypothetical protein